MIVYDILKDGRYLTSIVCEDIYEAERRAHQIYTHIPDDDLLEVEECPYMKNKQVEYSTECRMWMYYAGTEWRPMLSYIAMMHTPLPEGIELKQNKHTRYCCNRINDDFMRGA